MSLQLKHPGDKAGYPATARTYISDNGYRRIEVHSGFGSGSITVTGDETPWCYMFDNQGQYQELVAYIDGLCNWSEV